MTVIERLPERVYPLTQINKVNEIVDVLNSIGNSSFTALNPTLVPSQGVCTWTVTHNLATENVNCAIYQNDKLIIAPIDITSSNVVTVTLNSSSNIAAETYKIFVLAKGAAGGSGGGEYSLPTASTTTLGGVKIDGDTINIDSNGVISASATPITVDDAVSSTSENPVQNKVINAYYEPIQKSITTLASSGTISLADNSVNKITATGNVTFSLPSISDTGVFHQILVQLYMSTVRTINFGTTNYFSGIAPDVATAGYYTLIWEYDSIRNGWTAGAVRKG